MRRISNETNRRLVRAARPPGSGTVMNESTTGVVSSDSPLTDAVVMEDGTVRRRWTPGDPWDDNYYFGGSS